MDIEYVGLKEFDDKEKAVIVKISEEYYPKIERKLHNELKIKVHVKTYDKTGDRKKYSIHIKALAPTKELDSNKHDDWNLEVAMHAGFKALIKEIEHRFHD